MRLLATLFVCLPALLGPSAVAAQNALTPEEQREGWRLLFDGRSMAQWRGYRQPDIRALRWTVKDGCLALPPADHADTRGARDLVTRDEFDDFELAWDWRVAEGSNSGVKYFVQETRPDAIGHEYQLIDDARHEDAKERNGRRGTAAFYDVLAAPLARDKVRPAGTFNHSRILVRANHVEHWLNGALVLQYELDTDQLRAAIADSKFKDVAGFDRHQRGHLLLQDHGDAICFRNIKVRQLH
jgi:Domain of Unknown Function (DUF1080)